MRYFVSLEPDPTPVSVDVVELPSGALDVKIDGRPVDVDVRVLDERLSIRIDGQVVDLTTEGLPPELGAVASGARTYVRVESERMRAASQAKKGRSSAGGKVTKSPMPGRIVKILVSAGDVIETGQALVVVEAMKMENELRAQGPGTVKEVHIAVGASVEAGAILVTLA